jgi:hypothetical protein
MAPILCIHSAMSLKQPEESVKHPSHVSAVFTQAEAARQADVPAPTVNNWLKRGAIRPSGSVDGKVAFTAADIANLRKLRAIREAAAQTWELIEVK